MINKERRDELLDVAYELEARFGSRLGKEYDTGGDESRVSLLTRAVINIAEILRALDVEEER